MDLRGLTSVLLDTSACIYFLDRPPDDARHRVVAPLMAAAENRGLTLVLSPITVTELLVKPIRDGDDEAEANVRIFTDELCQVAAITPGTASVAARLRVAHRLRTPDAFIAATAIEQHVGAVIGNDARWRRLETIDYRHIDDATKP
jgi:predicted nucleic acid-binding protein